MSSPPIRPIPITTGGAPDLRDIVGREAASQRVVKLLGADSVLLTGDRRIGKTSLSKLVEAELHALGSRVARVSAERTDIGEFQAALATALQQTVTGKISEELEHWSVTLHAGPVEAQRRARPVQLDHLVHLALSADDQRQLILIIDEVPVLARAMEQREPGTGSDLLIMLRRIRQEAGRRVSMLLMGSMGFHHVAADAPGAVNDIATEPVGPISADDAVYLARCLMLGANVSPSHDRVVAEAIAQGVECVPYYVQHVVKDCRDRYPGRIVTPAMINELIEAAYGDGEDRWNLKHYRDRIPAYYGDGDTELVSAVLDVYAHAAGPVSIDNCLKALAASDDAVGLTRSRLVDLVEKLEQDHYLHRVGRDDEFRSQLLRRAWLELRR